MSQQVENFCFRLHTPNITPQFKEKKTFELKDKNHNSQHNVYLSHLLFDKNPFY